MLLCQVLKRSKILRYAPNRLLTVLFQRSCHRNCYESLHWSRSFRSISLPSSSLTGMPSIWQWSLNSLRVSGSGKSSNFITCTETASTVYPRFFRPRISSRALCKRFEVYIWDDRFFLCIWLWTISGRKLLWINLYLLWITKQIIKKYDDFIEPKTKFT